MSKKVVILSTSPRAVSNSDLLAQAFRDGAAAAGNTVEYIRLRGKSIAFCTGCMACAATGECAIKDDAVEIERAVLRADVIVWATPVYYHQICGQAKVLMDRLNPLFPKKIAFREVYCLCTAADSDLSMTEYTVGGVKAWADNFADVRFAGFVFAGGVDAPGEIANSAKLKEAYDMGFSV